MVFRAVRTGALAAFVALLAAGPLSAQTLTSIRGLGYPIPAADARAEVLDGLGVALKGLSATMNNPAAAAGVTRRGAVVAVSAVEQDAVLGEASGGIGATRFPLIQILYPVRGIVLTAGYGSYLDQSWAVTREGQEETGEHTIGFRDFVRSTGGIGQVQVGAAVPVTPQLAVGVAVGAHTGGQSLQFQRLFDTTSLGTLESFSQTRSVQYSAPMAQLGLRWDPAPLLRLGASVTWAGTLSADSASGPAVSARYELPLQAAAGVSANLAPSLLATVSGRWSGWGAVGDVPGLGVAGTRVVSTGRDTWEVGGGLEWDNVEARGVRTYPVRLGAQYRQLPFSFATEAPTEWFVGAGAGLRIGASQDNPLVRLDFTVQHGERTAPGDAVTDELTETAWRFSLSLSVFGN